MGTTLHAFTSYKVIEDLGDYEIHYENDEDYTIAHGNWHYIYTVLQYAGHLGAELHIPTYDWIESAQEVHENGLILTDTNLFIRGLEAVISTINQLEENENPLIDSDDWFSI